MVDDTADPDALAAALYETISGSGPERDWTRLRRLYHPRALLTPLRAVGPAVLDLDGWIAMARPIFEREGFHEIEIAHRTERYGPLAHRWSAYEVRAAIELPPHQRGVNSFQMIEERGAWRILSVAWRAETPDDPFPAKMGGHVVRRIDAPATYEIRRAVLRPHQDLDAVKWAKDEDPETAHFGAYDGDRLVGVGTLVHEPPKGGSNPRAWRLRGMATLPEARGGGHGGAIVRAAIAHVRAQGGTLLWFNARTPALRFYEKLGFAKSGPEFFLQDAGMHYYMEMRLA